MSGPQQTCHGRSGRLLVSNNIAEYNALLISMEVSRKVGSKNLEAYGDSMLIVNQVRREYEAWLEDVIPYYEANGNRIHELLHWIPAPVAECAHRCTGLSCSLFSPVHKGVRENLDSYS